MNNLKIGNIYTSKTSLIDISTVALLKPDKIMLFLGYSENSAIHGSNYAKVFVDGEYHEVWPASNLKPIKL